MKRLASLHLLTAFVLVAGCDTERVSRLEKENANLKSQLEKSHAAEDYELQAKCAKDSRAWFNESYQRDKDTIFLDFYDHYNRGSNRCFIVVEFHFHSDKNGSWMNDMSLWDVNENSKYGLFIEDHRMGVIGVKPEDRVDDCEVLDKKCSSLDQFNGLTQPYMNN